MRVIKKSLIFALFLLIFIINFGLASAISTDLKQNYGAGETLITKISGNILEPIKPEQVEFKRNNVIVPFPYDIKKLGDNYYLWAVMPLNETPKNYTLIIRDISTTVNGIEKKIDFMQNFSLSGNLSDYTVEPGFVFTRNNFEIAITLNKDESIEIDSDFPEERSLSLRPGKNIVKFSIGNIRGERFLFLKVGDYSIPAYIISNKSSPYTNSEPIQFNPIRIESIILISEEEKRYPISLINLGERRIENIYILYDDEFFSIEQRGNISLEPDSAHIFNLTLKKKSPERINSIIYARAENLSIELPIEIRFTENTSEVSTPYLEARENRSNYYCAELNGLICSSEETCSGESTKTLDGSCCMARCESSKKSNRWIGYLIAGIVIIILIFLYFKFKKTGPGNVMQKKIDEAEKRFPKHFLLLFILAFP